VKASDEAKREINKVDIIVGSSNSSRIIF
jgi:hypothetical protein